MSFWDKVKNWFNGDDGNTPPAVEVHWEKVTASSFADYHDRQAYLLCIQHGGTPAQCRKVGDPGVGWVDNLTATFNKCICALPPDDWMTKWGSKEKAHGKKVIVQINNQQVMGELGDTMPWKKNITNGAGIDLNPGFAKAFGLRPPFMVKAQWRWA